MTLFDESNINQWVQALGYVGIAAIIFSETAFFFCFILPGDSLLIAAGILAESQSLNLYLVLLVVILAAFMGYCVGYWVGYYFENWLIKRNDTWYFKKSYEMRVRVFMQKYEKIALLYGRFVPIVRTFIPMVAGMAKLPFGIYSFFNLIGAIFWGAGVTLLGFYLGKVIPDLGDFVWIAVVLVIAISFLPGVVGRFRK